MTAVQHLTVGPDEAEQRLDRWIRRHFPTLKQGRIEKLCRRGEIRIDGARAKSASRVSPGQVVRVPPLAEAEEAEAPPPAAEPTEPEAAALRAALLYRDEDVLILNKPPGLPVQGGSKQHRHLAGMLGALAFEKSELPRLVHRLDRDTSGALVLARTGAAAKALARLFRTRDVEKTYFALVAGRPHPAAGTIRYALVKSGGPGAKRMRPVHPDDIAATPGAQAAVTDYRVIEQAGRRAAWVVLRPRTGRTHQLRAHMAAIGCPIAGDTKYGADVGDVGAGGRGATLGQGLSRKLHLHAAAIAFAHPVSGQRIEVWAPMPEHMARSWGTFGWDVHAVPDPLFDLAAR